MKRRVKAGDFVTQQTTLIIVKNELNAKLEEGKRVSRKTSPLLYLICLLIVLIVHNIY